MGVFKRGLCPLFLKNNSPSPRVERGTQGVRLIHPAKLHSIPLLCYIQTVQLNKTTARGAQG